MEFCYKLLDKEKQRGPPKKYSKSKEVGCKIVIVQKTPGHGKTVLSPIRLG